MNGDPRRGRTERPDVIDTSDPYATLGLPAGAPIAEVKRAYRRLAKAFHPDSAGPEALPRFLAIHEAYERITTGRVLPGRAPARASAAAPTKREPWRADPARARATRGQAAGRTTRPGAGDGGGAARGARPGRGGAAGSADAADGASSTAGATGAGEASGSASTSDRGSRRGAGGRRHTRKATLGSTSYDDARDRADATWSGASWYGPTTGEYWIINPREYADPRKHGPAYQARLRERAAAEAARAAGRAEAVDDDAGRDGFAASASGPEQVTVDDPPSPERAAEGHAASGAASRARPRAAYRPSVPPDVRPTDGGDRASLDRDEAKVTMDARPRWLRSPIVGEAGDDPIRRLRLALIAWPPLGAAAAIAAADLTGCAVSAATCTGVAPMLPWLAQAVILALLMLLPPLARWLSFGTVAVLLALVPATGVLLVLGAGGHPQAGFALGVLLAVAWLGGVAYGATAAARRASVDSPR